MATSTLTDNTGTTGEVNIAWNDSEKPADFYAWRLYQRKTGAPSWTKIFETTVDTTSYSEDTWAWANGTTQEIILIGVSQNPTTGVLTETAYTGANSFTPVGDTKYTFVHPTDQAKTVTPAVTTAHDFSSELEHQKIKLLDANGEGGGRKINVGTVFGEEGSLSIQLRDRTGSTAVAQKDALMELFELGTEVFLRDPFGGLLKIFIESLKLSRVEGTGTLELFSGSISYTEVT